MTESYFPEKLLDSLAAGELDLVVAPQDEPREGLESEAIMRDPYVVLVPAGDPFLELGRPLTATDLTSRDLIGKDCATASQRALSAALADYGLGTPRIRAHDLREVQALVRRGLGDRRRAAAAARRARPDARDDPGRPPRTRPRDRADDARERRAHAGGRVRRGDPAGARRCLIARTSEALDRADADWRLREGQALGFGCGRTGGIHPRHSGWRRARRLVRRSSTLASRTTRSPTGSRKRWREPTRLSNLAMTLGHTPTPRRTS